MDDPGTGRSVWPIVLLGSSCSIAIALIALLGWTSGHLLPASFGKNVRPMAPYTAISVCLLNAAIMIRSLGSRPKMLRAIIFFSFPRNIRPMRGRHGGYVLGDPRRPGASGLRRGSKDAASARRPYVALCGGRPLLLCGVAASSLETTEKNRASPCRAGHGRGPPDRYLFLPRVLFWHARALQNHDHSGRPKYSRCLAPVGPIVGAHLSP